MAITLTQPQSADPIPVSDCLKFSLLPAASDVVTTPGTQAVLVVVFPGSPTDPGNGTTFVLWGFTMETNDATPATATSFEVVAGDTFSTMNNFADMILSNYYLNDAATVVVDSGTSTVTITWNNCGEQQNFGSAQMDFANIIGNAITSATPTNGTTPVYVEGFELQYKLWRIDINNSANSGPVTPYEGMAPNKTCTAAEAATFDAMPTVRELLKTPLPVLDNSHPVVAYDGILQFFSLQYGWTYRDANCQALSGDFTFSNRPFVWNAYFEGDDIYRVRKYWPGASGGLPAGQTHTKFLTRQGQKVKLWIDSKAWLWYFINEAVQSFTTLNIQLAVTKKDGSGVFTNVAVSNSGYGVNAINVSPSYIISLGLTGVTTATLFSYTVRVFLDGTTTQVTEEQEFQILDACDVEGTDVYFLNKLGGIDTLPVQIARKNADQQATGILLESPCDASREDRAKYGGRSISQVRSFDAYTFRLQDNRPETLLQVADMKKSPQRWARFTDESGAFYARKLILDPGPLTVREGGNYPQAEFGGYFNDAPIQSTTEPLI